MVQQATGTNLRTGQCDITLSCEVLGIERGLMSGICMRPYRLASWRQRESASKSLKLKHSATPPCL